MMLLDCLKLQDVPPKYAFFYLPDQQPVLLVAPISHF